MDFAYRPAPLLWASIAIILFCCLVLYEKSSLANVSLAPRAIRCKYGNKVSLGPEINQTLQKDTVFATQ